MDIVGSLNPKEKFVYLKMNEGYPIDSDEAQPIVETAVLMADWVGKIVHIQNSNGFTVHIIHPEDQTN